MNLALNPGLTEPWASVDSAAAWFFMARRDTGIFRRYARDIRSHFGDVELDASRVGGAQKPAKLCEKMVELTCKLGDSMDTVGISILGWVVE